MLLLFLKINFWVILLFENIRKIYDQISNVKDGVNYPMILVGNKVYLVLLRKVTEKQGRGMASELNVWIILCKICFIISLFCVCVWPAIDSVPGGHSVMRPASIEPVGLEGVQRGKNFPKK